MITRLAHLTSHLAVVFAMLCTLAACGGGGGGDGGFLPDDGNDNTYYIALQLLDADGNPINTISVLSPGTLQVRVTKNKKNGDAIADVVVTAELTLGNIFPASGSALTDADGYASFQIEAGEDKGAGTVTVSAEGPNGVVTQSLNYQIGVSGLRLGHFDENGLFMENEIGITPSATLSAQGQALLTVAIVDEDGQRVAGAESVRFGGDCLSTGQAAIDPASPVDTTTGEVNTTYSALGCSGDDEVVASLSGGGAQAFGSLSIAPAAAGRLTFVSADPNVIVLRGTGGGPNRQEFSNVVFRAVDGNNTPLPGIEIDFALTTYVGGLSVSPASAFTDSEGNVQVTVFSGDVATVVRVIATAAAADGEGEVSTISDVLAVSTGLPDQNSISLSVAGGFVVENGMITAGVARTLTVSMADKFNNPVPDGTAAIFTTEYGTIDPSCTTGLTNGERLGGTPQTGECSVQWTSGAPRTPTLDAITQSIKTINGPGYDCPSHNGNSGPCGDDLGFTRGGRSTVLVTAIGEESFIDRNGNGVMDREEKDLFDNVPEAHLDNNEDRIFNPAEPGCKGVSVENATGACLAGFEETFSDFNSNAEYDLNDDPAVYNGLLCPQEGDGVWCSRELVNVRDDTVLILSNPLEWGIILVNSGSVTTTVNGGSNYQGLVSDLFNAAPPAGSTITVEATGACTLTSPPSFEVPDNPLRGAYEFSVSVNGDGGTGTVNVTLKPKDGADYTQSFDCITFAPPDPNDLTVGGGG